MRWNSDAIVAYADNNPVKFLSRSDSDGAACRSIFGGIVEEVDEYLRQPRDIDVYVERFRRQVQDQIVSFVFDQGPTHLERVAQHKPYGCARYCQFDAAERHARYIEQIIHQARHVSRLAIDYVLGSAPISVLGTFQPQKIYC